MEFETSSSSSSSPSSDDVGMLLDFEDDDSPFAFDLLASPPRERPAGVFPIRRHVDPDAASEAEWCSCGSCQPTLPDEDLCCQEIGEMAPLLRDGCVTRNELFRLLCLQKTS
ncbi:hypothetical protein ISCGN_018704 [Ixodes scapularis]